jgi:hypothetical protein
MFDLRVTRVPGDAVGKEADEVATTIRPDAGHTSTKTCIGTDAQKILKQQQITIQQKDRTMTTMINPNTNGRRRATLNDQINRLDNMLDGLSEGLSEAVADAVKTGVGMAVKEAVQAVLTEVLSNQEIRAKLSMSSGADVPEHPNEALAQVMPTGPDHHSLDWGQLARAYIAGLRAACAGLARHARTWAGSVWQRTCQKFAAWRRHSELFAPFKKQILLALVIGTLVTIGIWYGGVWISALVCGIGGFFTTLAVQAGLWVRKTFTTEAEEMA